MSKMRVKHVSPQDVKGLLDMSNGRFVTVKFVKRTNSAVRVMNCRTLVSKGINGNGRKSRKPGLYKVYDVSKSAWRTINLSGVHQLSMNGTTYKIRV